MPLQNLYHRRLVAQSHGKACWICYRSSTTVLITPDSDDWFHICASHLVDRNFAIAKDAEEYEKRKRALEVLAEHAAIIKEIEEEQRLKLEKRKGKGKDKDKDKDAKKAAEKAQDEADEKAKQEKLDALEKEKEKAEADKSVEIDGPRVFELNQTFFNMRLQKKRDLEQAKVNRARLRDPNVFPTVPNGKPGGTG